MNRRLRSLSGVATFTATLAFAGCGPGGDEPGIGLEAQGALQCQTCDPPPPEPEPDATPLSTGLYARYCFDDPTNLGLDCSGNGRNLNVHGTVVQSDATLAAPAPGFGKAGKFVPFTDAWLESSAYAIQSGSFTVSAWEYAPPSTSNGDILLWSKVLSPSVTTWLNVIGLSTASCFNTQTTQFQCKSFGAGTNGPTKVAWSRQQNVYTTTTPSHWHHYAFVYSATTKTYRIDSSGNLVASAVYDNPLTGAVGSMRIGRGSGYNAQNLDEVRIYTRALSGADIARLRAGEL